MKGISPTTVIEVPGYVVMSVDVSTMLSNIVNIYVTGNRRSVFVSAIDQDTNQSLLTKALTRVSSWQNELAKIAILDVTARIKELTTDLGPFLKAMSMPPVRVTDLGAFDRDLLLGTAGWQPTAVISPSLGYPRKYLRLRPDETRSELDGLNLPAPANQWSQDVALTLLELDRGRFSMDLIPSIEGLSVGAHGTRERPIGMYLGLSKQLDAIFTMYMLYALQGPLLVLHANQRYYKALYELTHVMDVKARVMLERHQEAVDMLLGIPLHPLCSVVASALQTGTVKTNYGTKDLLYRYGSNGFNKNGAERDSLSEMRSRMFASIAADMNSPIDVQWGDKDAPKDITTALDLAQRIRSTSSIWEGFAAAATRLKWSNVSGGDIGEVRQSEADFILTDGEGFSDSPTAAMLGIKPVLSLGNAKALGFEVRFQTDFNAQNNRPKIEYSAVPVEGYQTADVTGGVLDRLYIMAGMWMGEGGVEPLFATSAETSVIIEQLLRHYEQLSAGSNSYVRQHYVPGTNVNDTFAQTDWDGWSVGEDIPKVSLAYLEGYKGQLETVRKGLFLRAEMFNHRCVVRISRASDLEMYDALGGFRTLLSQDGKVMFDDDISVTNNTSPLEAVVDIAPTQAGPVAKLPAAIGTDQVINKSEK